MTVDEGTIQHLHLSHIGKWMKWRIMIDWDRMVWSPERGSREYGVLVCRAAPASTVLSERRLHAALGVWTPHHDTLHLDAERLPKFFKIQSMSDPSHMFYLSFLDHVFIHC